MSPDPRAFEERDNLRDLRPREPMMSGGAKAGAALVVVAVAAWVAWWFWPGGERVAAPPAAPPKAAEAPAPAGPAHPIPAPEAPLPALDASDAPVREALASALPATALERLLFEGFVRNVVATIDNLPRDHYASRLNPVKPAPGTMRTKGRNGTLELDPANAKRHEPAVAAFEAVDATALAAFYTRHYPLFQQAYVELGYPKGYFNDRLVEVIDHLLATPEIKGPIKLVQPKVLYEFADPALEERSAGQKALVRLGAENVSRVKAKLREIRAQVAK